MKNIFRVPVDNQHYKDTIEVGKPVDEVAKYLSSEQKAKLKRIARDGIIKYWGSLPGENNRRHFKQLHGGDELLCYRSGKYIALAKIAFTTINPELAKYSWGETEVGKTWELIYFFSDVSSINFDSKIINKEFGYKDGPVMGFSKVSDEKARKFVKRYESVEKFLYQFDFEERLTQQVEERISKVAIKSPYEAQFYLVDLGNQLEYETYVPSNDAGRKVFGKKLGEFTTVKVNELDQYVAPAILNPLSNIDVIWFKDSYRPKFFYEVVHRSGMTEAFARLKSVAEHYEVAKTRIIGTSKTQDEFNKNRRLYFPNSEQISYKLYDDLVKVHSESLHFKKLLEGFLS